jgi:type II secretory pathway component PulF
MPPAATLVLPGQFTRRAELYHQLGQLTMAGLPIMSALEQLTRNPPAPAFREPLQRIIQEISAGCTFTESVQRSGNWISAFDRALLEAGERSGRLEACFRVLADYYTDRARTARQVIGDLAYPAFLFHFAIFIFPFTQLFTTGNWLRYLAQTLGVLLPLYGFGALLIYAAQGKHGERWRALIERILHPVPLLGSGRRDLALSRLAMALEALLSAGVSIIDAWELAATVSGSPELRRTVHAWLPDVRAGQTPAEALRASGRFPDLFANQYATGEISGKLDSVLIRLHQYYQEEGTRKLHAIAQWTPRLIYLLVALMIAWRIISFYTDYFRQVRDAGGF